MVQQNGWTQKPFRFLTGAFKILHVDGCTRDEDTIRKLFAAKPIFSLEHSGSPADAESRISDHPFHLCIVDLDSEDCNSGRLQYIKKFGPFIPIIVTGSHRSLGRGADCIRHGAFWALDKPLSFKQQSLREALRLSVLQALFGRGTFAETHSSYEAALSKLVFGRPRNVTEWADALKVKERRLRKICRSCDLPLRHMLRICRLVDLALDCYLENGPICGTEKEKCRYEEECRKLHDYYFTHLPYVNKFLAMQNGNKCEWALARQPITTWLHMSFQRQAEKDAVLRR